MKTKITIAVFALMLVVGCRRKSADTYEYYEPEKMDTTTIVADTLQEVIEEKSPEVKAPEVPVVNVNDPYFIVVASYSVEDFAISQKEALEKQGLKPALIMTDGDGWYKLAVQSFKSYAGAKQALPLLKEKKGIYSNATIVYKK